jgi:hypothetical protein
VIDSDLAQEQPLTRIPTAGNWRHHKAHMYAVTPGRVREDSYAVTARAEQGREFEALEGLRERLAPSPSC